MDSSKNSIKLRLIKDFYQQSLIASSSYSVIFIALFIFPVLNTESSFYKIFAALIAFINLVRVFLTFNKEKTIKEDILKWQLGFALINGLGMSIFFSSLIYSLNLESPSFWIVLLLIFVINGASAFSVVISPKVVFTFLTFLGLGPLIALILNTSFAVRQTYWLLSVFIILYYFFLLARARIHQKAVNSIYQLELDLLNQKKLADEALRIASLGELASGLAHEINNPLTIIQVNLKKHLEQMFQVEMRGDATLRVQKSFDASKRIEQVVLSLRSLAINNNKKNNEFEKIDLKELLLGILDFYRQKLINKKISLNFSSTDSKYLIYANKAEITQVIYHLINNAIDSVYNVENPVIDLGLIRKNSQIIFSIRDNGIGINQENREKLFIPFFTTKNSNLNHGIGLSICLNIISQHQGDIWLEDNPELKGADFRFSLKEIN